MFKFSFLICWGSVEGRFGDVVLGSLWGCFQVVLGNFGACLWDVFGMFSGCVGDALASKIR